jgi:hypothetical protein
LEPHGPYTHEAEVFQTPWIVICAWPDEIAQWDGLIWWRWSKWWPFKPCQKGDTFLFVGIYVGIFLNKNSRT